MVGIFKKMIAKINIRRGISSQVSDIYNLTRKFLPSNPNILEAGAHMGYDTVGLAKVWPKCTIYAIEPVPNLFDELQNKTKSLKNIKSYRFGFGPEATQSKIYISSGASTGSSSILKPTIHKDIFPTVTFAEEISIEIKTIDQWMEEEHIHVLDFLWLDMQGYEVPALRGATKALRNVSVIYSELCSTEVYEGMITQDQYIEFLKDNGFELIHLLKGPDIFSDGVFVNKAKLSL